MIVLAVETATGAESAALVTESGVLAEINVDNVYGHSSTLMSNIDKALKAAALDIFCVDAIAISAGPGSFTGLRVGFSLAKGLAFAAKKPFCSVPTLDALAYAYAETGEGIFELRGKKIKIKRLLCPLIDARKNEYYFSLYAETEKGSARLLPYTALPLEALIKTVKKQKAESIVFFGNGTEKCGEELKKTFKNSSVTKTALRASAVGKLALIQLLKEKKQDFNKALPLYVRKPDAVISKRKK